ncbi:MAG: transcriptional repressor [Rhodospirillaceae bacterium]|nr:transcriptional repressor [Rhodospirillaceae bacterium]
MLNRTRPFSHVLEQLRSVNLRPTRQRLALAKLLFEKPDRHITAESLHKEAAAEGTRVSLATVYNTLHQFTEAGLLREIVVDTGCSYFDTNTTDHHHYYHEDTGRLEDVPMHHLHVVGTPVVPEGVSVKRIDVVVRLETA